MKWKIVTDSGSTIRPSEITDQPIPYQIVPLMITIDNQVFIDNEQLDISDMLIQTEKTTGTVSTACPSPDAYAQAFSGADHIICFTLSDNLSGSFNSAQLGAQIAKEENPQLRIHIFNSHSAGNEIDLLIKKALELAAQDIEFEAMIEALETYHQKTDIVFLLENVNNLVKNGRINKLLGAMIGMLNIRLVGVRKPEGVIELGTKAKGESRGLKATLETLLSHGYQGGKVAISHALNPAAAEKLAHMILSSYPNASIHINQMSGLCCFYAERNGLIIGFEKA